MTENSCHDEHKEIKGELGKIEADLEFHIGEFHASVLPKEILTKVLTKEEALASDSRVETKINELALESKADRQEIHRQLDEIGETVLGEKRIDFDGNVTRTGGMKAMVSAYENGGLKFKWANLIVGALVTVVVALASLAGVVITHSADNQVIVEVNQQLEERLQQILGELEQVEP